MLKLWTIIDPRIDQERTYHGTASQSASRRNSERGFLNEIGVSQNQLAQAIGVPGNRIHAIVNGTRDITADTDLRLCKFFGLTEGYFCGCRMPTTRWRLSVRLRVRWRRSNATSRTRRHKQRTRAWANFDDYERRASPRWNSVIASLDVLQQLL
jgi:addiction module HigA family antidote